MTTDPTPFAFLEDEARRVAGAMAGIRLSCLSAFDGRPAARGRRADPWDGPETGTPRGPLGFSPFYYFPFLFAEAFPSLPAETLRTLCLADRVLLEALLLQDAQIDESRAWTPEDLYLVDCYHHRAVELLLPLFPSDHPFWARAKACFVRYAGAVLREQFRHRHRVSAYGLRAFVAIAAGKVALIRTTLQAMADLSGQRRFLAPLLASQTFFLVGFQAFDDLKDWKQDLRNRNYTHLLTRVILEGGFEQRTEAGDPPSPLEAGTVLYFQGIASDQLRLAERLFERALRLCGAAPVPFWKEVVAGFARNMRQMRNDFAEIRRRARSSAGPPQGAPGPRAPDDLQARIDPEAPHGPHTAAGSLRAGPGDGPGEDAAARILRGLCFLETSQDPSGGFPLLSSSCAYLSPARAHGPSRGATRLALRCLGPLEGVHPPLGRVLERAESWLASGTPVQARDPGLPGLFENAFRPGIEAAAGDLPPDGSVPPPSQDRLNGLFWTDQIHLACLRCGRLHGIERMALRCVRSSDYAPWHRTHPAGHGTAGAVRAACRPFLPLLLLLQTPGPDLFAPQLVHRVQAYLLGRLRAGGGWTNATDTALHLLCLIVSGYTGPERAPALDRILRLQESDGSWAPNAFYKQDGLYFGSRELTTAWCLLCLFLCSLGAGSSRGRAEAAPDAPPVTAVRFIPQDGVPPALKRRAQALVQRHASPLVLPERAQVTLGTWQSMPAHFLLPQGETLLVGINLASPPRPPFRSSALRPLEVEIVLGLFLAARVSRLGPLHDRLERLYVLGLALYACRRIWPGRPLNVLAGMTALEERWCREHEPYLWSRVRAFLSRPEPVRGRFRWLLPCDAPARHGPIPGGAALYLGARLFEGGPGSELPAGRGAAAHLLDTSREEILQVFRARVGLDPTLQTLLHRRPFGETRSA